MFIVLFVHVPSKKCGWKGSYWAVGPDVYMESTRRGRKLHENEKRDRNKLSQRHKKTRCLDCRAGHLNLDNEKQQRRGREKSGQRCRSRAALSGCGSRAVGSQAGQASCSPLALPSRVSSSHGPQGWGGHLRHLTVWNTGAAHTGARRSVRRRNRGWSDFCDNSGYFTWDACQDSVNPVTFAFQYGKNSIFNGLEEPVRYSESEETQSGLTDLSFKASLPWRGPAVAGSGELHLGACSWYTTITKTSASGFPPAFFPLPRWTSRCCIPQ